MSDITKPFLFLLSLHFLQGCALAFDATSGLPEGFYRVNGVPFSICHPEKEQLVGYLEKNGFTFVIHEDEYNHDVYVNHDSHSSVVVEKDWRVSGGRRLLIGKVDWCYWHFLGYDKYSHTSGSKLTDNSLKSGTP